MNNGLQVLEIETSVMCLLKLFARWRFETQLYCKQKQILHMQFITKERTNVRIANTVLQARWKLKECILADYDYCEIILYIYESHFQNNPVSDGISGHL